MNVCKSDRTRYGLTLFFVEQGNRSKHERNEGSIIAEIGKEIVFNPSILDTYHCDGWKPVHHDLLMVCAAVEFADRRCYRRDSQWSRSFHISIPVQKLKVWCQQEVKACLSDVLRHLTGDDWHFSFYEGERSTVDEACQRSLSFGNRKKFVIAYSDGLDSRCVSGILDKGDIAVRVRVSKAKDQILPGERPFDLIPFKVEPDLSLESSVRSRGFKFAAITAIAAHLTGISKIIVPESGQGALGPVLLPLHNIYADYRNHPTFFRMMVSFIQALLNYTVIYEQPRLWHTKGQTISAFLAQPGNTSESLRKTRSCWQRRMNVRLDGKLRQCGLCAACLLRRMSMHAANVVEHADTYMFADLTAASYEGSIPKNSRAVQLDTMVQYGSVGARHLQQLADYARQPDAAIQVHIFDIARATGALELETQSNLRKLLNQHREEWRDFISAQGRQSFLNHWIKGGRYDRFE